MSGPGRFGSIDLRRNRRSGADGTGNASAADDAASDAGIIFDIGAGDGGGPYGCIEGEDCEACSGVDILFVIDNSTSMGSYQRALASAAPVFADAIVASLPPGIDIHVGITTSSFFGGSGGTSPGEIGCSPYYEGAGMEGRDDLYDYYWTPDTMPYAEDGAQGRLYEHAGQKFFSLMSDEDPAALKEWMSGSITASGENGSVWEMLAAGAAYPFHPANAADNNGFLRDEGSVLAIFALTDEVGSSPEDVDVYHDMIVAAKQGCGGDACIVTGGVMKPCMASAPDNRLYPLLASFGKQPTIADIGPELDDCFEDCDDGEITECNVVSPPVTCQGLYDGQATPQYAEALAGALAQVIVETCEQIPPVG